MREENNKSVEAKPMCGWWPTCFSLNGSTQSVQLLIVHRKVKDGGDKKRQASLADVLFSSQSPHFHLCAFFLPATTSNEKTCFYVVEQTHIWTKALGISQDVLPTNRKGGSDLFGFSFYVVSFILIHALEIIFSKKNWEKKKKGR